MIETDTSAAKSKSMNIANLEIAMFIPDLRGGGAEKIMVDVCNGMAERGAHVSLLVARNEGAFAGRLSPQVKLIDLAVGKTIKAIPKLAQYMRERRPDILCSFLTHANVAAVLAKMLSRTKKTRLIISPHNNLSLESKYGRSFLDRQGPKLARLTYKFADLVVSCGECVAEDVRTVTGIPLKKSTHLPMVAITPELLEQSHEPVDHDWLANKTMPVITHFGRFTLQKDHANLIEAFAIVRAQRPCRLILYGEGELEGEMRSHIARLGLEADIDLPGFTKNPFNKMRHSDIVALSSKYEGLPSVLVQALACGAPIVSTDCPCGPDEVLGGGKWGKLVPVEDSPALGRAMLEMLEAPIIPTEDAWDRYKEQNELDNWERLFSGLADSQFKQRGGKGSG